MTTSGNLEQAGKQAKELLKELKADDASAIKRFTTQHPQFNAKDMCLADAQLVIAREYGFSSWPKMKKAFAVSMTLQEAITRLHTRLSVEGKTQYVPMLSIEAIQKAIITSIASYRGLDADTVRNPDYFENIIVPLLMDIVETGCWPAFAEFVTGYTLKDKVGVEHDGLMVLLKVTTPVQMGSRGFELSILDVWYGAWPEM